MRQFAFLLIGLFFGGGGGFLIAASQGITLDGHDHSDPGHHGAAHPGHSAHTPVVLPDDASAPGLSAELIKDAKGGWNLALQTENFVFSPENVNRPHIAGQGHAHVYVNGKKIARLYGPWMHIEWLPAGAELRVELNANDHAPLMVGLLPLTQTLRVPE